MGTKLGWVLSGVLVAAVVGYVLYAVLAPGSSPPDGDCLRQGFCDVQAVSLSPDVFLGFEPSQPGDAADDYRAAVKVYRDNESQITAAHDRMLESHGQMAVPDAAVMAVLRTINDHLAGGGRKKAMNYCDPKRIEVRVSYGPAKDLTALEDATAILGKVYYDAQDGAQLEKVLQNQFLLGWHMAAERTRAVFVKDGLEIQLRALNMLEPLYQNWQADQHKRPLDGVQQYFRAFRPVLNGYQKKWDMVWRTRPQPGNVFFVAQHDDDRAWRVDAILMCGVIRYTHRGGRGDSRMAHKLINRYADSSDPYEKAAAIAARELTPEGFKKVATP